MRETWKIKKISQQRFPVHQTNQGPWLAHLFFSIAFISPIDSHFLVSSHMKNEKLERGEEMKWLRRSYRNFNFVAYCLAFCITADKSEVNLPLQVKRRRQTLECPRQILRWFRFIHEFSTCLPQQTDVPSKSQTQNWHKTVFVLNVGVVIISQPLFLISVRMTSLLTVSLKAYFAP